MKSLRWLGKFWRAETGFFFALWLVLLIGGQSRLFRDPGTFWHTVVGEQILERREFPDTDSFSFTFFGHPWIPHQWLGECAMALLHRIAGLDTLLLASATLLAGLYAWAASRLLRAGLHWSLAAVLLILAVGASASHFHIRPHLGTMLFLAITFAILCDVEAKRAGLTRLWWLVPIFLLWTNTHGGMLGGLATLALVFTFWCFSWLVGAPSPVTGYRHALLLVALLLCCGLTSLVNPYGIQMPATWLEIMDSKILPQIILEHRPLNARSPEGVLVLLFGAVYLVALMGLRPQWPRACWLVPLVWFALALSRIRHSPLFALTALIALADVLPHTRWAVRLADSGHDLYRFPTAEGKARLRWRPILLPALAVGAALVLQWRGVALPVIGCGWARLDTQNWPVALTQDLHDCEVDPNNSHRIFNEYALGGFIIYHAPRLKVFVDDRCELYGDQWLLRFMDAQQDGTADFVEGFERKYGFDLALTYPGSGFDNYFATHSDWKIVNRTQSATLYRRLRQD